MLTNHQNIHIIYNIWVVKSRGGYGSAEFVSWCIVWLVIKTRNDWHDAGWFTVATLCNCPGPKFTDDLRTTLRQFSNL